MKAYAQREWEEGTIALTEQDCIAFAQDHPEAVVGWLKSTLSLDDGTELDDGEAYMIAMDLVESYDYYKRRLAHYVQDEHEEQAAAWMLKRPERWV